MCAHRESTPNEVDLGLDRESSEYQYVILYERGTSSESNPRGFLVLNDSRKAFDCD